MKTFFSVLCVSTLVIAFPVTLVLTLMRFQLLNADILKQAARDAKVGETIPVIVASNAGVSVEEVNQVLPASTTYVITNTVIDTVITTVVDGKDKINLKPLKTELEPIAMQFAEKSGGELNYQDMTPFSLNDEVTLAELMSGDDVTNNKGKPKLDAAQFNWLPLSVMVGWVVMAVALLVLVLLKMKPAHKLLKWLGITCAILMVETIPVIITFWSLPAIITPLLNAMDASLQNMLISVIERLSSTLAWTSVWVALALLIVTIILLVSSVFIKPRQA